MTKPKTILRSTAAAAAVAATLAGSAFALGPAEDEFGPKPTKGPAAKECRHTTDAQRLDFTVKGATCKYAIRVATTLWEKAVSSKSDTASVNDVRGFGTATAARWGAWTCVVLDNEVPETPEGGPAIEVQAVDGDQGSGLCRAPGGKSIAWKATLR